MLKSAEMRCSGERAGFNAIMKLRRESRKMEKGVVIGAKMFSSVHCSSSSSSVLRLSNVCVARRRSGMHVVNSRAHGRTHGLYGPSFGPYEERTQRMTCSPVSRPSSSNSRGVMDVLHRNRKAINLFKCRNSSREVADLSIMEQDVVSFDDSDSMSHLDIENVMYENGTYSVVGKLIVPVSAGEAYEVLTDYSSLSDIFHNIEKCSINVAESGEKHLIQHCSWRFLIFKGTFVTKLHIMEDPSSWQLEFSLGEQESFMRDFVGAWHVKESQDRLGHCEITHSLAVSPSIAPPKRLGNITAKIFVGQVKGILRDLESEILRRRAQNS